jgi:hypothetical protein
VPQGAPFFVDPVSPSANDCAMTRPLVFALLPLLCATPIPALTAEEMVGNWESVDGAHNTCEANPARLTVSRNPDHVTFDWPEAFTVFDGTERSRVDYDLIEERSDALVLRLEGEVRRTEAGETVVWLLRPDQARNGFCWGRTDWPLVRCEHAYRRCADPAPTS